MDVHSPERLWRLTYQKILSLEVHMSKRFCPAQNKTSKSMVYFRLIKIFSQSELPVSKLNCYKEETRYSSNYNRPKGFILIRNYAKNKQIKAVMMREWQLMIYRLEVIVWKSKQSFSVDIICIIFPFRFVDIPGLIFMFFKSLSFPVSLHFFYLIHYYLLLFWVHFESFLAFFRIEMTDLNRSCLLI